MHEAMCLAAISAWLCGLRDTQEYRVTRARQTSNPLVQGSNPWGPPEKSHEIKPNVAVAQSPSLAISLH
jgi:hypothetical protein